MAPSNYMNYYAVPTQQQQGGNYSYNSCSNARAAPAAATQYQSTPGPPAAQDTGYTSSSRTSERYGPMQNGASYSNRTNYDTNTLGVLSHNSLGNIDNSRSPVPNTNYPNYGSAQISGQTQSYAAAPQTSYSTSSQAVYGHQQVRPDSVNSVDSSQSSLSAPRPVQASQSQPSQYHQRVTSGSQRPHSPLQNQWTAHNQNPPIARNPDVSSRAAAQHVQAQSIPSRNSRGNDSLPNPSSRQTNEQPHAPVTVDPTQVYDPYQEYQRQAKRAEVEAEKRRVIEEAEAVERAKVEQATRAREEGAAKSKAQTKQTAPAVATEIPPPKKKRNRKSEGTPASAKSRAKGKKAAPGTDVDEPAQAAAMTLMQTANSAPGTDLETQMKEMFRKMREFNAKDPELLSRLWQQERDEHLANEAEKEQPNEIPAVPLTPAQKPPPASKAIVEPQKQTATAIASLTSPTRAAVTKATPITSQKSLTSPSTTKHTAPTPNNLQTKVATGMEKTLQQQQQQQPSIASTPVSAQAARTSGTIWPADKKQTLAAAASRLLQNMPANHGKVILPSEISVILDTNPSYIELCQSLESKGFKVDRSYFAKALLAAVPDVNKSAQKPMAPAVDGAAVKANGTTSASSGVATSAGSNSTVSITASTSLSNAADRLLSGGTVVESPAPTPPKTKSKESATKEKSGHQRKGKKTSTAAAPAAVTNSTASTQASAIMSDAGLEGLEAVKQFVDGSWQEGAVSMPSATPTSNKAPKTHRPSKSQPKPTPSTVPPPPATKEDLARKRTFADLVDLSQLDSEDESSYPPAKRHEGEYTAGSGVTHLPTPPETLVGTAATPSIAPSNFVPTISQHNSVLVQTSPLIRTRVEPQTPAISVLPTNHPARNVVMVQPLDKYKAIRRSTYNPKTVARDVLLACGRHPDMRHLNAHLEALKTVFTAIDNGADLGTFRWDIADPGGPLPGSGNTLPPGLEELEASEDADDEGDDDNDNDSVLGSGAARQVVGPNGTSELEIGHASRSIAKKSHLKKPRHSDPGIRSHTDQSGRSIRPRQSEGGNIRSNAAPDKSGTPAAGTTPSGYAALWAMQVVGDGEVPKRKGRPVGWRKWMMKDPSVYAGGAQGSKPKTTQPTKPATPDPKPVYHVYKCEWRDCGAELHNLVTLRRHIYKVHGKRDVENRYSCHWNECGKVRSVTENGRTSSRFVHEAFDEAEPWKQHIEKKHIQPVAWEFGDGPAGGLSDQQDSELSDAYLSDSRGRRVTPTVVVPSVATLAASSTPRGITNAEREARELQRIAEKRKRDMGPGIDKGGARLANDKRRQGFIDDDDTAEVVDNDD